MASGSGKRQRRMVLREEEDGEVNYCHVYEKGGSTNQQMSPVVNNASEPITLFLNDPELLDCPICCEPLCNVIYQVIMYKLLFFIFLLISS